MEAVFIRKERSFWIYMLAIGMIGFVIAAITLPENGGHSFDKWAHQVLTDWRSEGLTIAFKLMTMLGSTIWIIGITLISAGWFGYRYGWRYSGMMIGSVLIAISSNLLLKMTFDRVRPDTVWSITADGLSFPSGHSMLSIVMFGMLMIILLKEGKWSVGIKSVIVVIPSLFILLIGASRIYFHVHYISDVLAGYSAGLVIISGIMLLAGALRQKRGV
ncbi:phosphatase PAP2 family protein [Paenibacillus paeoniae]|uniref:PAP2 family protein n=1 Tax=Paenibacillus paeoniae TaxID=2292705 RepID=A0A371PLX0_9BACL|nr:phosphatase PAP2 family protein [Paenibacillus paeoniae]REK77178.1 PAP2 family protein [Paenibacillus paeoniae]